MNNKNERDTAQSMTMLETLEAVKLIVGKMRKLQKQLIWQLLWPPTYVRMLVYAFQSGFFGMILRRDRSSEIHKVGRQIYESLATPAQKASPYFEISTSRFLLEALAAHVRQTVPKFNAEALLSVHAVTNVKIEGLAVFKPLGVVLSVGTLILHEVPNVILKEINVTKDTFDLYVFLATSITLGYLLLILGPIYLMERGDAKTRSLVGDLLTIMAAQEKGQQAAP